MKTPLVRALLFALLAALPVMGQNAIGPPQLGDQTIEVHHYPGKVFARLGTVPNRVAVDTRQIVPLSGTGVTLHTFLWSTTGNATINVDIESSTDCVNWDSVSADVTTESDSRTFEGGFCAVAITIDALSAGYTEISYLGTSAETGGSTAAPGYARIQDGDSTALADVFSPTGDSVSTVATSSLATGSLGHVFNSTSAVWERMRSANTATGANGTGLLGVALLGFDGSNYIRVRTNVADAETGQAFLSVIPSNYNGVTFDRVRGATVGDAASSVGLATTALHTYNGTTFDRARDVNTANSANGTGLLGVGLLGFDATNYIRLRTNTGDGESGQAFLAGIANNYNGTTFDRVRGVTVGDNATTTGLATTALHVYDGATFDRVRDANTTTGTTGTGLLGTAILGFDATNYVRIRTNVADGENGQQHLAVNPGVFNGSTTDRLRSIDGAASTGLGTLAVSQAPNVEGAAAFTTALTSTLAATVFAVKASAGNLYGYDLFNDDTANCFCQIFNTAAGSVILGTTVPVLSVGVKGDDSSRLVSDSALGNFTTAISAAFTTTATGSTACPTVGVANFFYK